MNHKMQFKILHNEYYLPRCPFKIERHPSNHGEPPVKTFKHNTTVRLRFLNMRSCYFDWLVTAFVPSMAWTKSPYGTMIKIHALPWTVRSLPLGRVNLLARHSTWAPNVPTVGPSSMISWPGWLALYNSELCRMRCADELGLEFN